MNRTSRPLLDHADLLPHPRVTLVRRMPPEFGGWIADGGVIYVAAGQSVPEARLALGEAYYAYYSDRSRSMTRPRLTVVPGDGGDDR